MGRIPLGETRPTRDGCAEDSFYWATELDKLQGEDMKAFSKLGVRSVYDLRNEAERTAQPDQTCATPSNH